jgi:hypothetical protein
MLEVLTVWFELEACAECRRLKVKCDRTVPCSTWSATLNSHPYKLVSYALIHLTFKRETWYKLSVSERCVPYFVAREQTLIPQF